MERALSFILHNPPKDHLTQVERALSITRNLRSQGPPSRLRHEGGAADDDSADWPRAWRRAEPRRPATPQSPGAQRAIHPSNEVNGGTDGRKERADNIRAVIHLALVSCGPACRCSGGGRPCRRRDFCAPACRCRGGQRRAAADLRLRKRSRRARHMQRLNGLGGDWVRGGHGTWTTGTTAQVTGFA